jgi:putative inorganic carbon (HCO3(-)) transporter
MSPSMDFSFITGKNFAFRIIVELSAVLWLGLIYLKKEYRIGNSQMTIFILLFTFITGLADMLGVNPYNSFWSNYERMEGYITVLHLTLYFMIIKSILKTERDWKIYFNLIIIAGLFVSIFAFLLPSASNISPDFGREYVSRVYSTIGNPPFLASYLLLVVFIGFFLFFITERKYFRFIYILPVTVYFIAIYFTASRGAVVAAFAGMIMCGLLSLYSKTGMSWKAKIQISVSVLLIMSLIAIVFFMTFRSSDVLKSDKTLSRFSAIYSDQSVKSRISTWRMAWNGIKERPLLGWGQENYSGIYTVNTIPVFDNNVIVDRAHNIMIDWLVNAGLLGLLSYLAIFYSAFLVVWSTYRRKRIKKPVFIATFTALAVYFIQNMFTFDTINSYLIFFSILAYIDSVGEINAEKSLMENAETVQNNIIIKSLGLVLISMILLLPLVYHLHYKPSKVSKLAVRITREFPRYKSFSVLLNDFNHALSYKTFGSTDIRIRMLMASSQIRKHDLFAFEGASEFIQRTIEELEKGLEYNRYNINYISSMIKFYYELARLEPSFVPKAEQLIKKIIDIYPGYEGLYYRLADVHLLNREYEEAFKIIDGLVDHDALNEKKQLRLAEVAVLTSREMTAERALEKVRELRINRDIDIASGKKPVFSVNELYHLARKHVEIKNFDKALELYREIITISPPNAKYHFESAEIYWETGDRINAEREAVKASEIDPLKYNRKIKAMFSRVISP